MELPVSVLASETQNLNAIFEPILQRKRIFALVNIFHWINHLDAVCIDYSGKGTFCQPALALMSASSAAFASTAVYE